MLPGPGAGTRPMQSSVITVAITALTLAVACRSSHVSGQVQVIPESPGIVRLLSAGHTNVVDLRKDISGCFGELYDSSTGERFGQAGENLRVLDVTELSGQWYVLLSGSAHPNCNVQGACGASSRPDTTLIWLHLDPQLSVVEQHTFAVEDCRAGRTAETSDDEWASRLHLSRGVLLVEFRESFAGADGQDVVGQAVYDRGQPTAGIRITRTPSR
jgi:hypothetical protein